MTAYKKGNHCNNGCAHFFAEWYTVYNPSHGGNPGSTDYDVWRMYCCVNSEEGDEVYQIKYNCPLYKAKTVEQQETP